MFIASRRACRLLVAVSLLSISAQIPHPASAQEVPRTYRVVHVENGDVLNIRTAPLGNARVVGEIPPNGRGVELVGDCRTWCPVRYNGVTGWVAGRYLRVEPAVAPFVQRATPQMPGGLPTFWRVTGVAANDVLEVRKAPTEQAPVVYGLAPQATCIVFMGGCQKPWCQVQFPAQGGPQTGWVHAKHLVPTEDSCR